MRLQRREFLLGGLAAAAGCSRATNYNVLFIMTDDHAAAHVGCYGNKLVKTPHIDRLAREGVRFTNAFVTNSLCAPSRATVLTGCYSHLHGIRGNSEMKGREEHLDKQMPTFPGLLQSVGYRTGIVGKWHLADDPAGFNTWRVLPGQGEYFNPEFIENGKRKRYTGYATDLTTDFALEFLRDASTQPWCLVYQHKAPHRPFLPPPRYAHLYDNVEIPLPSTFDDDYKTRRVASEAEDMRFDVSIAGDYKDLPAGLSAPARKRWLYQRFVKDYYGAIAAVDEGIGRVLQHLEEKKQLDNTLIIYTSDNGFFVGDHGWYDKRFMYEPSLRVPLIVRAPGGKPASTPDAMAVNIDIAPTILDYAGMPPAPWMQGRSLRPLLQGAMPDDWRKSVYYAYYENSWQLSGKGLEARSDPSFQFFTPHRIGPHRGVRTATHKLIHYYSEGDVWELFDLSADPNELNNLYGAPGSAAIAATLKTELERLRQQYKDVDKA
ncbi:MAG TPA: sulfatase [Bryobacteraceae bacterium]|nr:sulfatase [Bryobacteraceae bacterium]